MTSILIVAFALRTETDAIFKKFMKFKFSDIRGSELDWMHVHQTLINKGLAGEGFSNLVSRVTTLKHQVFVLDSGAAKLIDLQSEMQFGVVLNNVLRVAFCTFRI